MQNNQLMPAQPQLGTPIPGTTGGLPAQGGLSVFASPMAQQLQSLGRGDDKMLVHMTPNEVNSLQGLAMATGGSLTINPHTGLPEAGWLGKLLPTILGVLGAAVGIPTWAIGLGGTAIGTAVTGDLSKGLMAGLGAYGGAGLGNAVGLGGSLSKNAFGLLGEKAATDAATNAAVNAASNAPVPPATPPVAPPPVATPPVAAPPAGAPGLAAPGPSAKFMEAFADIAPPPPVSAGAAPSLAQSLTEAQTEQLLMGMPGPPVDLVPEVLGGTATASTFAPTAAGLAESTAANAAKPGFLGAFKNATNIKGTGNIGAIAGGLGVLNNISEAFAPKLPKYEEEEPYKYEGPYVPVPRTVRMPTTPARERGGREHLFFDNLNPVPGYVPYKSLGMAEGGRVPAQRPRMERNFGFRSQGNAMMPAPQGMGNMPGGLKGGAMMPAPQGMGNMPGGLKGGALQQLMAQRSMGGMPQGAMPPQRMMPSPMMRGRERDHGFRTMPAAPVASVLPQSMDAPSVMMPQQMMPQRMMPQPVPATMPPQMMPQPVPAMMPPPAPSSPRLAMDFAPALSNNMGFAQIEMPGMNRGGEVPLSDGAFVLDARTVSEIGNGSSNAGKEALARIGGRPIEGPGDGVSDSVPARIGRDQPARVARDEVVVPADVVRRIGKGSPKRGADKLYDLMKKAHKARKKAKRGQDTKLRKGLA